MTGMEAVQRPTGECVHCSAGRLRIRIKEKRGDADFFETVRKALASRFPKAQVTVNPDTASVLSLGVHDRDDLAEAARDEDLFDLELPGPHVPVAQAVQETFKEANLSVKRTTRGELDLPTLVFLILVGSGIVQILRGNVGAPPWYTAFWYALGVFTKALTGGSEGPDQGSGEWVE